MAMENGITPVMPIGNSGFNGDSAFLWIFALLILATGGFGGFGFGGNNVASALGLENIATSNEVQRGFDNQNAMANQREILAAVNAGTAQSVATTNQTFHDMLMANQGLYNEVARDISNLQLGQANTLATINECCCNTRMAIAQNDYNGAMRDAATNANLSAQIQSVKDMIAQNKIEALQSEVNKLQLAQATSGMLRFPNTWSYDAGQFPPVFTTA